jgi:Na+-driven multidrug efflux pump
MGQNRQFAINMFAQIVAFIINLAIGLLLPSYIVNNLGKEAYGFVGLANNFVSYAQIITVAIDSMSARFITIAIYRDDYESANKYFSSVYYSNLFLSGIICIASTLIIIYLEFLVTVPPNILFDVKLLYAFVFLNAILSAITNVYGIATFVRNRLELASIRAVISNIIRVVVLIGLFWIFKPHVWYLGLTAVLCTLYITYTNIGFTRKLLPEINVSWMSFNIHHTKELLASGMWNTLSKLSEILSQGFDLLIANIFIGAAGMGMLSISKTVPTMILSVFAMLASLYTPQLTASFAKNNYTEIKTQLLSSMRLFGCLTSIPMAILYAYGDLFFKLWIPHENALQLQTLAVVGTIGMCFALPQEGLWNIFTITNKVRMTSINLLLFSLLIFSTVFIGVHMTSSITNRLLLIASARSLWGTIRVLTFLPIFGAKCMDFKWNTFYPLIFKSTSSIFLLTGVSFLIRILFETHGWFGFILLCLTTIMIGLISNFYFMLNKTERDFIVQIIKSNCRKLYNKHIYPYAKTISLGKKDA